MQSVIISILHYNNSYDTIDCLRSLMSLTISKATFRIIVLDNGSDNKFKVSNEFKNVEILRSNENLGFSGGHNFIYEKVRNEDFDFFLALNNDCVVDKKLLTFLIEGAQDRRVGLVVPKIYFTKGHEYHKEKYNETEKGKVFWYAGGFMDWKNVVSQHRGIDEVDHGQFDVVENVDFATGCCMFIRKIVIEKLKLFDEKYFLYYEDADLSQRILKGGFLLLYQPKAIIWHNNAGSSGAGSNLHDYYLTRNRMLFGMRYAHFKIKLHLVSESIRLLTKGRKWQKIGVFDYYRNKFGKGSFVA